MGLSRAAVGWLMEEAARRPFSGTLLTLGVQNVFLNLQQFEDLAARMGVVLRPPPAETAAPLISGTVSAAHVFTRLGFDRVVSMDVDDFEDCDVLFDLNAPEVPPEHRGTYDMVLDAGTLEHVFHLPNAFRNLVAFTRTEGRIVHLSPSSNHIDHGFHMFSPTLFWDYYSANGLEMPRFDLFRYNALADTESPWIFGTYTPGALGKRSFGGLGGGCFGIALVAEKPTETDGGRIPQQGMYAEAWAAKAPPGVAAGPVRRADRDRTLALAWKRLLRRLGRCVPVEWRIRLRAARRGFPLPVRRRF